MTKGICPPSGCCFYCWPLFCTTSLLVSCLVGASKPVIMHHPWYATHCRLPVVYYPWYGHDAMAGHTSPQHLLRSQRWPPLLPFSIPATSRPGAPSAKWSGHSAAPGAQALSTGALGWSAIGDGLRLEQASRRRWLGWSNCLKSGMFMRLGLVFHWLLRAWRWE